MEYNKIIGEAIVFIENHLYEPLSAAMVADSVSYSYYHFHRYFSIAMGETVGSYIRGRRLTQAGYDLVHSQKKILDIALSLYFESAESFTRAFKKKYGLTPREYRKNGVDVLIASHPAVTQDAVSADHYACLRPDIVVIAPKRIAGISFKMSISDNQSIEMWDKLNALLSTQPLIPLTNNRYSFYEAGIECQRSTFHESSETRTFIGIEWGSGQMPKGMREKQFSGGKYARFVHKGTIETLIDTYRYIWGVWFPQSGYELAERDDFECYTDQFLDPLDDRSEIEIYFPIQ